MNSFAGIVRSLVFAILFASFLHGADTASITGTVKDPEGGGFKAAFVKARNQKTKITVNVLSDKQGRYHVQNLPPGTYDVTAAAIGYKDDQHAGVAVAAGAPVSLDLNLQKGMVRWGDLTTYQGMKLLPDDKGKAVLIEKCFMCHQFQTRMASAPRSAVGWAAAVKYMRVSIAYRMTGVTDQDAADITAYLDKHFGMNSDLPKSPADLPAYQELVRPVSDEALNIVYTDYEMPEASRFPWSAAPDNKGNVWIPYFGHGNKIAKMDTATGAVEEFKVPFQDAAGVHSVVPTPDGTVWLAEQGSNRIGKWDPATREITEYQDNNVPGARGGGGKVTVRVNAQGQVWGTGNPFARLDPATGQFKHFEGVAGSYGMVLDKEGNAWFTQLADGKSIGRVDAKTGRVTRWAPPTPKAWPRRMAIDSEGMIYFGEYDGGKIGRFDPKTETFKEYPLPGAMPKPYALGVDANGLVWYSSMNMNTLGCLDPKTGKIVEYPLPYPENTMREFFMDAQGRMWYGTPANNRVGYFTLASGS